VALPLDTNYSGGATNYLTIQKATPVIQTPPTASAITAGQSLVSSLLNGGSANVPGTFAFTTPSTVPASTVSHSVTFSPTDTTNYNTVTTTVSVTVNPASGISNWLQGQATNAANVGKYLIGGATNVNDASERPVMTANSSNLVLSAIVRTNDTNGKVVGQWVTNLSGFSGLASGSNEVTGSPAAVQGTVPDGCQRQEFMIGRTNATNRLFLRLKATLNP